MSLTADPADVAAWERRPATTLDAFQLIADGVTAVGGFGVAAISVVRGASTWSWRRSAAATRPARSC